MRRLFSSSIGAMVFFISVAIGAPPHAFAQPPHAFAQQIPRDLGELLRERIWRDEHLFTRPDFPPGDYLASCGPYMHFSEQTKKMTAACRNEFGHWLLTELDDANSCDFIRNENAILVCYNRDPRGGGALLGRPGRQVPY